MYTSLTNNTSLRIGKQQVVWGVADGIKLLDIINPTDIIKFSTITIVTNKKGNYFPRLKGGSSYNISSYFKFLLD